MPTAQADPHTLQTPERSLEQRLRALAKAQDVRLYRARLKREIRAGQRNIWTLADDPRCGTMKVWEALSCVPKYGRSKVNRAFISCRISPSKTFAGLTERQASELRGYVQ